MRDSFVTIENKEKYMNPIEHFESGLSSSQVSHSYHLNKKRATIVARFLFTMIMLLILLLSFLIGLLNVQRKQSLVSMVHLLKHRNLHELLSL